MFENNNKKIVIDTNILVSSVLFPESITAKVLHKAETFAKPQNNSFVLRFSLFQHNHNKIKQNNHTNLTITAHFQAALCPFRQQSAQQALTCLPL